MNQDPRLILAARRACGKDDTDPVIASALAQAKCDPQLCKWLESEQEADSALTQKLRQIQPPPGLREAILTGASVSRGGWRSWFNRRAWRNVRNSELLALVAIVLIFAAALASRLFVTGQPTWQHAGVAHVAQLEKHEQTLEHFTGDLRDIQKWLAGHTCPAPPGLPPQMRGLSIFGCTRMSWRGEPMSVVCFDLGGGKEVHLVTISRTRLAVGPPAGPPEFAEINGYQTASWSEGEVAMMLVGKVPREDLERLFKAEAPVALRTTPVRHRRG